MRKDRLADRQTDMTKLMLAFRNFANASKNIQYSRKLLKSNYTQLLDYVYIILQ